MRLFLLSIILFFCMFSNAQVYEHGYKVKVGQTAPDFKIHEVGGDTYHLSDLRGHVVMLQFTASWCSVCHKEMPFIEKEIWQKGKSKGLKVIGIDRDEPAEKVKEFAAQTGVTYPLAVDPGAAIFAKYAQKQAGVTRNVVIDRSGKIIFLTRLFKREEFNQMKAVIFKELESGNSR